MRSRIRWTAQRWHAAPWKTSPRARTRPGRASETTSSAPETPRPRAFLGKASREPCDSVSTASTPRARLRPPASRPMAATTAVDATRPSRRRFTQAAPSQAQGKGEQPRGLPHSSPASASRLGAMALAWSFESLDTPIFSATRRALRVLAPVAHVSAAAATRARSTRRQRSIASPGKKLPVRSLGMRGVSVPAQVASALSR